MDDILFDSRSELDKLPFGAVSAGTRVRFGIRARETLGIKEMRLIVINDGGGAPCEYPLEHVWTERGYSRFEGSIHFKDTGLFWYHFKVFSESGERIVGKTDKGEGFSDGAPHSWQLTVYSPDYTTPEWIKGGAFYQIFVDRFYKSGERPIKSGAISRSDWGGIPNYKPDENGEILCNDFFGGNLDGVIEKLPYLHELGISCIYLNPIFEASSNHKYDTADYMKIDSSFGEESTFAELCSEAEKLGIRVICDGVFNHTGMDSIYFNRFGNYGDGGAYRTKDSPYYEWYGFSEWPDKYDAWWGIKTLPQVRKDSASYRSFIAGENGVLHKWMSIGAFGWRLDVVDELSESFVREIRRTVKSINPQALIIGEVWEDASNKIAYGERRHYFEGMELDGVMNYPLRHAIIGFIKTGNAEKMREGIESLCENYPKPALDCLMNILGTHDTVRILTFLSGKEYETRGERAEARLTKDEKKHAKSLLKLASLLQFTLPGVPCIYYGDEAGMEGYEDPFCRRCYPWGEEDTDLLDWYKKLSAARQGCTAFAGGEYRTLRAENGVFAFERFRKGRKALVLVNMGTDDVSVELSDSEYVPLIWNCEKKDNSLRVFHEGCVIVEMAEA